jgi:protein phosphatase
MIESYGLSDVGRRRSLNEDSLLVDDDLSLYAVADGMGGHNAGEVASQLAIETVSNFVKRSRAEQEITWPYGIVPQLSVDANRLRTAVLLANKRVWKEADNREDYTGMGTTLVAALAREDELILCSAGDSRAYRFRAGELEQITVDDSWVQAAYSEGILRPEEIDLHPMRNIITKAIGARESVDVAVTEEKLQTGDLYLLCSDGLHGMVKDEDISAIIGASNGDLKQAVELLIQTANKNGGKDNVTAIIFRYQAAEP